MYMHVYMCALHYKCVFFSFRFFTLYPGDVVLTGTPPGVGCFRKPPIWLKVSSSCIADSLWVPSLFYHACKYCNYEYPGWCTWVIVQYCYGLLLWIIGIWKICDFLVFSWVRTNQQLEFFFHDTLGVEGSKQFYWCFFFLYSLANQLNLDVAY